MADVLGRHAPSAGKAIPQLDALRGIGIVSVFVQHLGDRYKVLIERLVDAQLPAPVRPWIMTVLNHAWWGVDLFFVLSGFSLGLAYLRAFDKTGAPPSARHFFMRRAARILPGFWLALALVLVVRHSVMSEPGFPASLLVHLGLLQGYIAPGGITLIGASWTLTTEGHFYLLFPLLALPLLARRRWKLGLAICVAGWLVRAGLHALVLEPGVRTGAWELTQRRLIVSRLDQFVLGSLAALAYVEIERAGKSARFARIAPGALVVAAIVLVIGFRLEGELFLDPGGSWPYAILSLATTAIVLGAALLDGRAAALFTPAPLIAIGVVSYGVFLNHQLILGYVDWFAPFESREPSWARLAFVGSVTFLLSLLVGLASWRLVELPSIRWVGRITRPAQGGPNVAKVSRSGGGQG